ncbi:MAG: ATP-dependent Clp protease adaptor ClpS [Victivallales bacterium]|nr:ATP-dependent Clp protease adaptor ClpS [Victivallales bacterium]
MANQPNHTTKVTTTVRTERELRPPQMYDVVLYNDNVTTMEFVVALLMTVFEYDREAAVSKMLQIHHSTSQVIATYPKTVAEYKKQEAEAFKTEWGYPYCRLEIVPHGGEAHP